MTDKLGIPIKIGDTVATSRSSYVDITIATVESFTPKMVKIKQSSGWRLQISTLQLL